MANNILITTYHEAYLKRGGGEYELFSIAEKLRSYGLEADIYGPYSRDIKNYEYILHFSVQIGGLGIVRLLKSYGKKIILWPNFWPTLDGLGVTKTIAEYLELSDVVIFKSKSESDIFTQNFNVDPKKIRYVTIRANPIFFNKDRNSLFPTLYNLNSYAISFGIIEPIKNQLSAIEVMIEKNIPLVLVGGYRDRGYYDLCVSRANGRVIFIDSLPMNSDLVVSALQNSLFYIEVSIEPPGLSAIEAGLAGCKLVVGDSSWAREVLGNEPYYCDVNSRESSVSVECALAPKEPNNKLSERLKSHIEIDIAATIKEIIGSIG